MKFEENAPSVSPADTCGQTDGRTHVTKLITAFRECAKVPKSCGTHV